MADVLGIPVYITSSRKVLGGSAYPVYITGSDGSGSTIWLPIEGGTLRGDLNLGGFNILNYGENVITATVGGTYTINASLGNIFVLTLTGNTIFTIDGLNRRGVVVHFIQGNVGSNTITFSHSVNWAEGTVPTWSTTVGYRDKAVFDSYNGTVIDGALVGLNMS